MRNMMACGEFFQCIDEEPHGRVCAEGLWFNYLQQVSDLSEVAQKFTNFITTALHTNNFDALHPG